MERKSEIILFGNPSPSSTWCIISVVWVVKFIRWLDTLINKGEIHTEEANSKRHKFSADRYFHLPNLVGEKDFHQPKRNFHLQNGSLVDAFRHPGHHVTWYDNRNMFHILNILTMAQSIGLLAQKWLNFVCLLRSKSYKKISDPK